LQVRPQPIADDLSTCESMSQGKQNSMKMANTNSGIYEQTLSFMMKAQQPKAMPMDTDSCSFLTCTACNSKTAVVDTGNDDMFGQETGEKDLIQTLLSQKCKCCDKFSCKQCLDECFECNSQTCKLCLDYVCVPATNEQHYVCANCKYY